MSVLPYFEALGRSAPGQFLRDSTTAFALTEAVHLVALSLIGGVVAAVGLSTAGLLVRRDWAPLLSRSLRPLFLIALGVVVLSGIGLVAAGPYKYYTNPVFWIKIGLLAIAVLVYAVLDRRLAYAGTSGRPWRLVGALLVAIWLSVAIAGRVIGLI